MFRAQKVYVGQEINRDRILASLVKFITRGRTRSRMKGNFPAAAGS
ncbi:MAG: hypothetical protein WC478_05015 [Candidatus Omnitrophota bacterium]